MPSSWALVAVDAASRHDAVLTALPLAGLVALTALLVFAWSRVLGPPRLGRPVVRGTAGLAARPGALLGSATGLVYLKELRTWCRSPLRVQNLVVPPVFAILSCLVPVVFGSSAFLPFTGALTALMGAATSANLYGQDGTALWQTLLVPGAEANDVRGRQFAWITLFGPLSLLLALIGTLAGGDLDLWPWAAAATVGVLGAGAGLVPLLGITQLAPGPDPHRSRYSPMDHGNATGGAFTMLVCVLVLAVPALVPVIVGTALHNDEVRAAGVAVGVITGMAYWGVFAGMARRRLVARGPELLVLMRAGKELPPEAAEGGIGAAGHAEGAATAAVGQLRDRLHRVVPAGDRADGHEALRQRRQGVVPRALPARRVAVADDRPDGARRRRRVRHRGADLPEPATPRAR